MGVAAENLYWQRNDAKFRAAKNHATYEEFEQIVKGSHLKPLGKEDRLELYNRNKAIFNTHYSSTPDDAEKIFRAIPKVSEDRGKTNQLQILPKKCNKNTKDKTLTNQKVLSSDILQVTMIQFHEKISSENKELEIKEVEKTLEDIRTLTDMPRFEVELCFASEQVKDISSQVFQSLEFRITELALNQEV